MRRINKNCFQTLASKGFTLLEVLIVLGILSLIISISTPLVLKQFGKAKTDAARVQVNALAGNVEFFIMDVGRPPTDEEGIQSLVEAPPGLTRWRGPYVKKARELIDPWGKHYRYKLLEKTALAFEIYSYGSDDIAGGEGEGTDVSSLQ